MLVFSNPTAVTKFQVVPLNRRREGVKRWVEREKNIGVGTGGLGP